MSTKIARTAMVAMSQGPRRPNGLFPSERENERLVALDIDNYRCRRGLRSLESLARLARLAIERRLARWAARGGLGRGRRGERGRRGRGARRGLALEQLVGVQELVAQLVRRAPQVSDDPAHVAHHLRQALGA